MSPGIVKLLVVACVAVAILPLVADQSSAQLPAELNDSVGSPGQSTGLNGIDRGPRVRQLGNVPTDVGYQIQESNSRFDSLLPAGPLSPLKDWWREATGRLNDATGLDVGFNYTAIYQRASAGNRPREGSGGDFDLFGEWRLSGNDDYWPGDLIFSSETRHRITSLPPSDLSHQFGSLWGTTTDFNEQAFSLVELYWDHGSFEDGVRYRAGRMDPANIYNGYRFASDEYAFLSPAFSDTLPMALPGAGFGAAVAIYPTDTLYVLAGIHDANGERTRSGFAELAEGEFFTALEFGITPNFGEVGEGSYHVTLWHADARRRTNQPSDRGIAVTVEQQVGCEGRLVPFARCAIADRGLNDVRQNFSLGIGLEEPFGQNADLIALGFSWGEPANPALRDQYTLETLYRVFLTPHTHLTPDLQIIFDPANAPQHDVVAVFGLRLRTLY